MRTITNTIEVPASPETVWDVLTDGPGHSTWDPHVEAIEGSFDEGAQLEVKFRQGMTFRPTVTEVDDNRRLEWLGKLLVTGLFDGRHSWELEPTDTGTRITQSEEFSGILVPLMGRIIRKTEQDFAASNAALAEVARGA